MNLGLDGKTALVTGGTRGIGRATVVRLLSEGANVVTCGRTEASVDALRQDTSQDHGRLKVDIVDVRDGEAVARWFDSSVAASGRLDVLVSNVSMANSAEGEQRWAEGLQIDLLQHVRLVELATPLLVASGIGSITFVNSLANVQIDVPRAFEAYAVFKAGLLNYAAQLSLRLNKKGVRVNSVSPGPIVTPDGAWDSPDTTTEIYKTYIARSGFKRFGTPEEVADAIVFLASPLASWISNVNVRIDGGAVKSPNF